MSASTTQVRRGSWGEVLAVLAVILGMLVGFGVITAAPAWADAACDETETQPAYDFERLFLELEEIGGSATLEIDTIDDAVTCSGGNSLAVFYQGDQVNVVDEVADAPNFHLSCSVNYDGLTVEIDGTEYEIIDYILASRHVNTGTYHENCEAFPVMVPVTLLKLDETEAPLAGASFLLDGLDDGDYECTSDDEGLCDFGAVVPGDYTLSEVNAPEGYEPLVLTEEEASVTVSSGVTSVELGPFVNTPTPPPPTFNPAITLVKDAVVGEGSDLVDVDGPNPLLQFSDTDTESQTALYSYLITNTGDEALVNISLTDDRIAATDLDFSDCTAKEPLAPGETCTATGSEDFTPEQAEAVVDGDGIVTNTGTVTADGEQSEEEVTDTDPATIAFELVFSEVNEKPDPAPEPEPETEELPAPEVESAAEELPATGLDAEGLLPLSLLLIAIGGAILWLDRPWVGVR